MGLAAYSRYRCVYVILKTLMRRFLSAKSQVFESLGCQFEGYHSLTPLCCLFPSPKAAGLDRRESEERGGYDAEGRTERV